MTRDELLTLLRSRDPLAAGKAARALVSDSVSYTRREDGDADP